MPNVGIDSSTAGGDIVATGSRITVAGSSVVLHGDSVASHGDSPHDSATIDTTAQQVGQGRLKIAGVEVAFEGDEATCGDVVASGSSRITVAAGA